MVMLEVSSIFLDAYNSFVEILPPWAQSFISFFLLVLLVVIYSTMIWKFYQFISRKNPLGLNLNEKYKPQITSFATRLVVGALYFVEYLLILPIIIFIVFSVFTFFLIVLSSSEEVSQILIISATVIASIRITAYYKESLSQEIAKLLPFLLLATAVLNPATFSQIEYVSRIINLLGSIPAFLGQIWSYLFFIILIEITLNFFDLIFSLFNLNEPEEDQKK
jgi:hypothetical protein